MPRGSITRRGKQSWRLKFDVATDSGQRLTRYATIKGRRSDAERELTRLIASLDAGTLVEPSTITVEGYLRGWLDGPNPDQPYQPPGLAPKTLERYRQLASQQIYPHLGAVPLQKLRPKQVEDWHATLLATGGKDGRPLSARTVLAAHRILHRALARAAAAETVSRNVASVIKPPKVEANEIEILTADQIAVVLSALKGHALEPIAVLALATGARRGEILGLRWGDVDFETGEIRIERSLEQTRAGLRFKSPKTKHGKRTVSLPTVAVSSLQAHRRQQLEIRMALGQGRATPETLVFSRQEGEPIPPNDLSRDWARFVKARKLPAVSFHGLRHSHVSALIAARTDILTVSRRIGHASPAVTLAVYSHLFKNTDKDAANAIEAVLRTGGER
jgi:integrase